MFSIFKKAANDFASNLCEEVMADLGLRGNHPSLNIKYGKQKANGGHDHRTSKGPDRTPKQVVAAAKRRCRNK